MEFTGFDEYATIEYQTKTLVIKVVESKIENVQRFSDKGYEVMLKKGNKYYVGREKTLDQRKLAEIVNILPESQISPIISDTSGEYSQNKVHPTLEELYQDVSAIPPLLEGKNPIYGTITVTIVNRNLNTSKGLKSAEKKGWINAYFRVKRGEFSAQWAHTSNRFEQDKLRDCVETANELLKLSDRRADVNDGKYTVVLSPLVMANLMMYASGMASGFSAMTGNSIFSDSKKGDEVASDVFTLRDIPDDEQIGNWEFDDEGERTFRKEIIYQGKFNTHLLNNETAKVFNAKSTGNAGWIYPRSLALEIDTGTSKFHDMMDGNFIYVNNNWYTRFQNMAEGQFSTVTRDATILFRNGKPEGFVGRVRIADKLGNIVKNVIELSRESYVVSWWDAPLPGRYPFAKIDNVSLTRA
ncbi:hypothetical protein HS7_02960 [Sulfolobales archaeon HS-7]|nr:hypothetical protein HS7_02960 [Sulfolobales archaeon HS-7]